jgi:hypothetical protein
MRAVADRLSLNDFVRRQLTDGFTTYLSYLVLASEGGFDPHMTTPVFVCSAGCEPPVQGARTIALDIDHADLLRDRKVHELVAALLGEHLRDSV